MDRLTVLEQVVNSQDEAIKELKAEVQALKAEVQALKAEGAKKETV